MRHFQNRIALSVSHPRYRIRAFYTFKRERAHGRDMAQDCRLAVSRVTRSIRMQAERGSYGPARSNYRSGARAVGIDRAELHPVPIRKARRCGRFSAYDSSRGHERGRCVLRIRFLFEQGEGCAHVRRCARCLGIRPYGAREKRSARFAREALLCEESL